MSSFFPSLVPSASDPLWFTVDKPCDDEEEISKLEVENSLWVILIITLTTSTTLFCCYFILVLYYSFKLYPLKMHVCTTLMV